MTTRTILALTDISLGVLLLVLSLPILFNKIPPNPFYGIRTPKAFRSEKNWYLINHHAAKYFILWSLALIVAGSVKLFVPWDEMSIVWKLGPMVLCGSAPVVHAIVYSWRL